MIKCIDCRRYVNSTCYLKAIRRQDYHVKPTDSCKNGIEKIKKATEIPTQTKPHEKATVTAINQSKDNQQTKEDKQ